MTARCVRCGHPKAKHPEDLTPAEALLIPYLYGAVMPNGTIHG